MTPGDIRLDYAQAKHKWNDFSGTLPAPIPATDSKANKKGHRGRAGYAIAKNWSADVPWLSFERDEDYASANVELMDLHQFDVN